MSCSSEEPLNGDDEKLEVDAITGDGDSVPTDLVCSLSIEVGVEVRPLSPLEDFSPGTSDRKGVSKEEEIIGSAVLCSIFQESTDVNDVAVSKGGGEAGSV